eukprot:5554475-Pyramimonas_sp.AAC.1
MAPVWACGTCGFYNFGHRATCKQAGYHGQNPQGPVPQIQFSQGNPWWGIGGFGGGGKGKAGA